MHVASGSASRTPTLCLPWQRYHVLQVIVISTKSQRLGGILKGHSEYQKSFFFTIISRFSHWPSPPLMASLNYSRTKVGAYQGASFV